jgi:selenocysteine lyase/cysteine desulfurase
MSTDLDIQRIRSDTPGLKNVTHLLACGSALMPECVIDAVVNHIRLEGEIGGYEAHARQNDLLGSGPIDLEDSQAV